MNFVRQLSSSLRPLAWSLALLGYAALVSATSGQAPQPDTAELRSALAAKRPAKLKRPPPELSAPARPVRQAAHQAEVLPGTTRPRIQSPAAVAPQIIEPRTVAPETIAPQITLPGESDQDYIVLDDSGVYGPGYETYGGQPAENRGRIWGRAEYLMWWVEGFDTPPLVTTSGAGTLQANAGILGLPSTTILYGDEHVTDSFRNGLRATAGAWFDQCGTIGVQGSAFGFLTEHDDFSANSAEFPILARPFFNVEAGFEGQDAELIAFPGLFTGRIDVSAESTLFGAEALLRYKLAKDCLWRVDGLAGARYMRLDEQLRISDDRTVIGPGAGVAIGTTFEESDLFDTRNQFWGPQLGFVAELHRNNFFFEATLKLALGVNERRVHIAGESIATVPAGGGPPVVVVTPAGLLAQATNIGTYEDSEFSVIPEIGFTVGYDITPRLRAVAGYTFLYWTDVVRPGDQIDTNLNLSQLAPGGLVGVPRPEFRRTIDNVWMQGLSLGIDFRF